MSDADIVFLIRGLTREKRHWEGFDEKLQESLPNKKVICLDLPGFGDNIEDRSPLSIKKIAEYVLNLKTFKEYSGQKKSLVGLSLGGMVSLEMASLDPDDFESIVIINSSQRYKTPFHKRINFLQLPRLFFLFLFNWVSQRERLILKLTTNTKYDSQVPKKWEQFYFEKPFKKRSALFQTLAGGGFSLKSKRESLKSKKGLVLVALKDRLVHPVSSEMIAKVLEWPIERHKDGGHDLPYDDALWVIDKIKKHLNV